MVGHCARRGHFRESGNPISCRLNARQLRFLTAYWRGWYTVGVASQGGTHCRSTNITAKSAGRTSKRSADLLIRLSQSVRNAAESLNNYSHRPPSSSRAAVFTSTITARSRPRTTANLPSRGTAKARKPPKPVRQRNRQKLPRPRRLRSAASAVSAC